MARRCARERGQSVVEYAVLITVAIAVVVAGQIYFKRALQGRWKGASDQIGEQFTTAQNYTIETREQSSREEVTGSDGEITAGSWTRSAVLSGLPQIGNEPPIDPGSVGGVINSYSGHETTIKDYVNQTFGKALGDHGTFDSGQLSNIKLFDDD